MYGDVKKKKQMEHAVASMMENTIARGGGVYYPTFKTVFVASDNSKKIAPTLAHEIGHAIMHEQAPVTPYIPTILKILGSAGGVAYSVGGTGIKGSKLLSKIGLPVMLAGVIGGGIAEVINEYLATRKAKQKEKMTKKEVEYLNDGIKSYIVGNLMTALPAVALPLIARKI